MTGLSARRAATIPPAGGGCVPIGSTARPATGYVAKMYSIDLGEGAQLRPLEPWQAEEFLAHMDRARDTVDPWIPWASLSTDLESATARLQRYADLAAQDA